MKLYSFPGSCALAANIALEWAGAPYELALMTKDDLVKPEFLKINPNHQVPALEDGDWTVYQNAAVMAYISAKHPHLKLEGDGTPKGVAEVQRWFGMLNSDVHPAFKPLFGATAYLDDEGGVEKTKANALSRLRVYFTEFDGRLADRDWLAGERSIADPYLFVVLRWARAVGVDLSGLDNLKRFEKRMRADAGVKAALKKQNLDQV